MRKTATRGVATFVAAGLLGLIGLLFSLPAGAQEAKPQTSTRPSKAVKNVEAVKGSEVYQLYCAPCHGATGDGNGPVAAGLNPRPTDFTDQEHMSILTDEYLATYIEEGPGLRPDCPMMPAWVSVLRPEDTTAVVAYIRSLARPLP